MRSQRCRSQQFALRWWANGPPSPCPLRSRKVTGARLEKLKDLRFAYIGTQDARPKALSRVKIALQSRETVTVL